MPRQKHARFSVKRLLAATAALAVATLGVGTGLEATSGPDAANAAAGGGSAYVGTGDAGSTFIGSYKMADGTIAWYAFDKTLAGVDLEAKRDLG